MPKLTENIKVEDGLVYANVSTNKMYSECEFAVCSVETYEDCTEDEIYKILIESMWESGQIEVYF